jgi:hypothetical protein
VHAMRSLDLNMLISSCVFSNLEFNAKASMLETSKVSTFSLSCLFLIMRVIFSLFMKLTCFVSLFVSF